MHTLPGEAESAAQHVARRLNSVSPATIAIAQRVADVAFGQAVNAFQASLPLLRATRGRGSISPSVRHITDDVVGSAERLGSSAAKAARTLALLSALQEGAQ
jgi:hypothetical protein